MHSNKRQRFPALILAWKGWVIHWQFNQQAIAWQACRLSQCCHDQLSPIRRPTTTTAPRSTDQARDRRVIVRASSELTVRPQWWSQMPRKLRPNPKPALVVPDREARDRSCAPVHAESMNSAAQTQAHTYINDRRSVRLAGARPAATHVRRCYARCTGRACTPV